MLMPKELSTIKKRLPILFSLAAGMLLLSGCASIQSVGHIGPNKLKVFSISHSNFLNSSQMLVVLDKSGNVSAYTGGTASGWGTVGLQTGSTLASAGAVMYGANAIKNGLQSTTVNVKGIPSRVDINAKGSLDVSDKLIDRIKK